MAKMSVCQRPKCSPSSNNYDLVYKFPKEVAIPIKEIYEARRERVRYSGYSKMMLEEMHPTEIGNFQMYQRAGLQQLFCLSDNVLNEHELKFNQQERSFLLRAIRQGILLFNFNWTHNIDSKLGLQFMRNIDKYIGPVLQSADKRSGYKMRKRIAADRKHNKDEFKWSESVGTHNGHTLHFHKEEPDRKRSSTTTSTTPPPKVVKKNVVQ